MSTEELRAALLHYRGVFEDLLRSEDAGMRSEADSRAREASERGEPSQQSTQRGNR
jgi:hypothetical protein